MTVEMTSWSELMRATILSMRSVRNRRRPERLARDELLSSAKREARRGMALSSVMKKSNVFHPLSQKSLKLSIHFRRISMLNMISVMSSNSSM